MLKKSLIFFYVTTLMAHFSITWAAGEPFQVRFTSTKKSKNAHQKLVELKMAKSLAFCRGFYLAKKVKPWSCKTILNDDVSCSTDYRCANIHKGFSRVSEQKRLTKEFAPFKGKKLSKHKLFVSKRPYKSKKVLPSKKPTKVVKKTKPSPKVKAVSGPVVFKEEEIELFNDDQSLEKELAQEFGELEGEPQDRKEEKKTINTRDEDWRFAEVDQKKIEEEKRKKSRLDFRRFSSHLIYAADDLENSYFTIFGLGYVPTMRINEKIYVQLELSLHQFSLDETSRFEAESFLVYTYGGQLHYRLNDRFDLFAGLGLQSWGASRLESASFFRVSYGVTYFLKKKLLRYIDRITLTAGNLSSENNSVGEMRLGLGFTF